MEKIVVLIVEVEALIRLDAANMAREAGYVVVEAANAGEAIEILERRSDIRIVFTDFKLPGSMDGLRLARAIRDRWPPVRLVVTSGRVTVREGDLPSDARFIPKPYNGSQLAAVLHEIGA